MKLISKYTSDDYKLDNGSTLNINANHNNDGVRVSPKHRKQGEAEIQKRILNSVEVDCTKWNDEVRIDLSKYEIVASEVDVADDGSSITIVLDGDEQGITDRHKLTIKVVNTI